MADQNEVIDNPEASRFELIINGDVAIAAYRREGDTLFLTHTEVPKVLEGHGVGSALIAGALRQVRARHEKIVPQCAFVRAYLERHPKEKDLVAGR